MADDLDLLTLDEAKPLVGIAEANTDRDDEIAGFITAVSRRLDELTGPIVQRTITNELYNGGCNSIHLRHAPITSITSVTEYLNTTATVLMAQSNSAQSANDYVYDDTTHRIYRQQSGFGYYFPVGRRNIAVTYVAGRYADTASVDAKFKRAAGIVLAHLWRVDRGSGTQTFGEYDGGYPMGFAIPNRALDILGDDLRAPLIA